MSNRCWGQQAELERKWSQGVRVESGRGERRETLTLNEAMLCVKGNPNVSFALSSCYSFTTRERVEDERRQSPKKSYGYLRLLCSNDPPNRVRSSARRGRVVVVAVNE